MADTAPQGDILNDDKATWEAFEAYLLNKIDDIDLVPQPTPADIRKRATAKYGNSISKVTRDIRDWIHGDAVGGLLDGVVRVRGGILLRDSTLMRAGAGDPEGTVAAAVGSMYLRTDAPDVNTLVYVKTSGSGNTGWQAVTSAGGGLPAIQNASFGDNLVQDLVVGSTATDGLIKVNLNVSKTNGENRAYRLLIGVSATGVSPAPDILSVDSDVPFTNLAVTVLVVGPNVVIRLSGSGAGTETINANYRVIETLVR